MRYTENSHDIKNPADLIRVVSSCIILSLFRMVNEYSKRVMFLGHQKLKTHFSIALGINGLMLIGEFVYRFVIGNRVVIILETHFIPLVISFIFIAIILLIICKNPGFDVEVSVKSELDDVIQEPTPNPDIVQEDISEPNIPEEEVNVIYENNEILTIVDDEPATENNILQSVLRGSDIDKITEELYNEKNSLGDLLATIEAESEPILADYPETSAEIEALIEKDLEENRFGMNDFDDDDDLFDEELFQAKFDNLFE